MTASREDKFVSKDEATYWPFAATTYRDLIFSLLSPWDVSTPQVRRKEQLFFFALFFSGKDQSELCVGRSEVLSMQTAAAATQKSIGVSGVVWPATYN